MNHICAKCKGASWFQFLKSCDDKSFRDYVMSLYPEVRKHFCSLKILFAFSNQVSKHFIFIHFYTSEFVFLILQGAGICGNCIYGLKEQMEKEQSKQDGQCPETSTKSGNSS